MHAIKKSVVRLGLGASTAVIGLAELLIHLQPRDRPTVLARALGRLHRGWLKRSTLAGMRAVLADRDWSAAQYEAAWRDYLWHVGLSTIEPVHLPRLSFDELRRQTVVEGEQHLEAALEAGRGAMLFISHVGSFTLIPTYLARRGYDVTVVTNEMRAPYLDKQFDLFFERAGVTRVRRGELVPQAAARTFGRNALLVTYVDVSIGNRHSTWIPFGPAEFRAPRGPAVLAVRHRVPVLFAGTHRLGEQRHRIDFRPPLEHARTGPASVDRWVLMRRTSELLLDEIRAHPEQWWGWAFPVIRPRHDLAAGGDKTLPCPAPTR